MIKKKSQLIMLLAQKEITRSNVLIRVVREAIAKMKGSDRAEKSGEK